MIIIPSSNRLFSITLQGDYKTATAATVYALSRTMLRVKRGGVPTMSLVVVDFDGTNAKTYYTDTVGALEIPLHSVVNTCVDAGTAMTQLGVTLKDMDGTTVDGTITVDLYPVPGVSYADRLIPIVNPFHPQPLNTPGMELLPPTKMMVFPNLNVDPADYPFSGVIMESNLQDYHGGAVWSYGANGSYTGITPIGSRGNQINVSKFAETLRFSSSDFTHEWRLELASPFACVDVVCIRWTSLTGAVRQHWFPVVGLVNDTDRQVSLLSAGDGYRVRKNPTVGMRCRLTGLTEYDVWYYQDMMQASDAHAVRVSRYNPSQMPPWNTFIGSTQTAALVEGGMADTPEGNGFFNFEFVVKYRHYDAI